MRKKRAKTEAEKSFEQEVREKRRAANGAHSLKGKRGFVGTVRTPADLMDSKARREYEAPSEIIESNLYDTVIPYEEFLKKPKRERTISLYEWRKRFTARQICAGLGLDDVNKVYYLFRVYGVVQSRQKKAGKEAAAAAGSSKKAAAPNAEQTPSKKPSSPATEPTETKRAETASEPKTTDCDFQMHGAFSGSELTAKLQGLAMMSCESQRYWVNISWKEL